MAERTMLPDAPTGAGADLLASYARGATFLAGPSGTLLAEGTRAVLRAPACDGSLPGRVAALLDGRPDACVVGAVPFEPDEDAALRVPASLRRAAPLTPPTSAAAPPVASGARVRALPRPGQYRRMVRDAVTAIDAGVLDKVVLSRSVAVEFAETVDPADVLAALVGRNPGAYLFAVDVADPADGPDGAGRPEPPRTLVGASPELLVSRRGTEVSTNPLAGSTARRSDPADDARAADALLVSAKDRHEHALVVEAVADTLAPFCRDLEVPPEPELLATSALWHLSTRVRGTLADPDDPASSSLALGLALHPTPAVCGAPRTEAHRLIRAQGSSARGFYSGLLGWSDARGDGEWVVALRCGELAGARARVHAGAGIVAASTPEAELAETRVKLGTFLAALGLDGAVT